MKRKIAGPAGRLVESSASIDSTPTDSNIFLDNDNEGSDEYDTKFFIESAWCQLLESYECETVISYNSSMIGNLKAQIKSLHRYLIEDVISGSVELKVPTLAAIIGNIQQNFDKSYIMKLTDPSASIISYMTGKCFEQYRHQLARGSVLLLTNVTIFTRNNRNNSQNVNNNTLIIHPENINAIFIRGHQHEVNLTNPVVTRTYEAFESEVEASQMSNTNVENLQITTTASQNKRRSID